MTEIVNEMKSLMNDERNLFKKKFGEKYDPTILVLIQSEVYLIYEKIKFAIGTRATLELAALQNELEVLNKKCDEIAIKFEQGLVREQNAKLFTTFASCFSMIATHSNFESSNKSKMIEKAHECLNKTMEIVDRFPYILHESTLELFETAYSNFATAHIEGSEIKIECLKKILNIREKYDVDKTRTLFHLGVQHLNLSQNYFHGDKNYGKCFDKAFMNFEKSKESFSKILENGGIKLDTEELGELYRCVAISYKGLGILRFDLKSILNSEKFYKIALEQQKLSFDQQKEIELRLEVCQKEIVEIKKLLVFVQNKADAISEDQMSATIFIKIPVLSEVGAYGLQFFLKAIDINLEVKDENTFKISLEGKNVINRLQAHLKQELNLSQNVINNALSLKTENLSQNDLIIQTAIMTEFREMNKKFSKDCKNAEIEVSTKGLSTKDLKDFCQSQLKICLEDLEFFESSCWISLNKKSIEVLREKLLS